MSGSRGGTARAGASTAPVLARAAPAVGAVLLGFAGCSITLAPHPPGAAPDLVADDALTLHFLDVGQGDAVLLQGPEGGAVLYDGGPEPTRALAHLQELEVEELDLVVASHPHRDHVGGLPAVLGDYEPDLVLDNDLPHTTVAYERYLEAVRDAGARLLEPTERTITLGSVELRVLPPPGRPEWNQNDNSVGLLVEHGEFRATLAGDAETRQWEWWLEEGYVPGGPVAVHKASHHGSARGDVEAALERMEPEVVVIGVGAGNAYDHPHDASLALYEAVGAEVYRTDRHGTVRVTAREDGAYQVEPERAAVAGGAPEEEDPAGPADCVDINRAGVDELVTISHIGDGRARQIVELRGERPFEDVEELTRVRGIGETRVREIVREGVACVR